MGLEEYRSRVWIHHVCFHKGLIHPGIYYHGVQTSFRSYVLIQNNDIDRDSCASPCAVYISKQGLPSGHSEQQESYSVTAATNRIR